MESIPYVLIRLIGEKMFSYLFWAYLAFVLTVSAEFYLMYWLMNHE